MTLAQALIVDDDPVYAAIAEDLLLDAGVVSVIHAEDGAMGLSMLDSGLQPDLMLCDLNMPVHDGVSLIRGLAERRHPGRIVIVSSETDPVIEAVAKLARLQGLRVVGHARKPLTPAIVADLLSRPDADARHPSARPADATPSLLDAAIRQGGLHPFFQPKVRMSDGALSGAEALARIATPQSPHSNPVPYVELAERNNRIDELTLAMTRAVARHACDFVVDGKPLPVSINISPVSLARLDFPDLMEVAVLQSGLACAQFTLEVTETRLVEYGPRALDVMSRLRIKGFGLSVDDFGTGYSNIDRLQMYPFSELKIDQSFTKKALEESFARACVETSVRLARELGLHIVAEGVETVEMWDFLRDLGVDEAQGYLMSRPLPPADMRDLIAGKRSLGAAKAA